MMWLGMHFYKTNKSQFLDENELQIIALDVAI